VVTHELVALHKDLSAGTNAESVTLDVLPEIVGCVQQPVCEYCQLVPSIVSRGRDNSRVVSGAASNARSATGGVVNVVLGAAERQNQLPD